MKTEKEPVSSISNEKQKKENKEMKMIASGFLATIALFFSICVVYDNCFKKELKSDTSYSVNESKQKEANYSAVEKAALKVTKDIAMEVNNTNVSTNVAEANIDATAPIITLNNQEVSITAGDNFDLKSNIKSITDNFDGNVEYSNAKLENKAYYTITSNYNKNKAGEYTATVKAYDSNNNESTVSYKIKVATNPNIKEEEYSNRAATVDTSSVIAAANSLKGTKYRSGGTSPDGFDCSGFVQYVYAAVGKSISRSSSSQNHDGVAVSQSNLQPGDIIIWANNGSNSASHSSIYVGNNTIIHATTNKGVHTSNINSWSSWGQHIIGVRRV